MARIGIKLADGSFYPILEDETRQKKRLVLTAARDGQTSAQIDLLRQDEQTHQYVGCLVLEDLPAEGVTELELVVSLDDDRNVEARISDAAGAQYQSLAVNLDTLTSAESFSLPDEDEDESFGDIAGVNSLEEIGLPDFDEAIDDAIDDAVGETGEPAVVSSDEPFADAPFAAEAFSDEPFTDEPLSDEPLDYGIGDVPAGEDDEEDLQEDGELEPAPRPFSSLILAAILLLGVSAAFVGAFLIFRWLQTDPLPELRAAAIIPFMVWPRRRSRRGA